MTFSAFKEQLAYIIIIALFIKLMAFGLDLTDCLGALVLLIFVFGAKITEYYVPKRPDLYADFSSLQELNKGLASKVEDLERDVMSIKMGHR